MIPNHKRLQIIAELRANPNAFQVARNVSHVSHATVCHIAREEGIDLALGRAMRGVHGIGAAKRVQIIAELKKDPNIRRVMRRIGGIGYGSVWAIAHAEGIDLAGRQNPPRSD